MALSHPHCSLQVASPATQPTCISPRSAALPFLYRRIADNRRLRHRQRSRKALFQAEQQIVYLSGLGLGLFLRNRNKREWMLLVVITEAETITAIAMLKTGHDASSTSVQPRYQSVTGARKKTHGVFTVSLFPVISAEDRSRTDTGS
ncbi:MAG: hypothetical protein JWM11_913 [Planctomycetaceae bacterium]|nr:hypothetical protein [Planctomycetaceae bacterium]